MQKIFFFIPAWPWLKAVPRCRDFPPCPIHNWWTLSGRPAGSPWFCGRRNDSLGAWAGCWGCAVRWQCWGVGTGQPACLWSSREPRPESPTRSSMSSENRMKSQINVMPQISMSSEIRGWKSQIYVTPQNSMSSEIRGWKSQIYVTPQNSMSSEIRGWKSQINVAVKLWTRSLSSSENREGKISNKNH